MYNNFMLESASPRVIDLKPIFKKFKMFMTHWVKIWIKKKTNQPTSL